MPTKCALRGGKNVAAGPDVILAHSSGAVAPLLQATNTILSPTLSAPDLSKT
jgi:hypothetical protein